METTTMDLKIIEEQSGNPIIEYEDLTLYETEEIIKKALKLLDDAENHSLKLEVVGE